MLFSRFSLTIALLFLMPYCQVFPQDYDNGIDSVYGFDQFLYNGKHYSYQLPGNVTGNPYLFENGFEKGCLAIKGRTYCNLDLNYDLCNQLLLLKYRNHEGAEVILEIPDSWLERLRIGSMDLEPALRQDGRHVVCQVMHSGQVKVRYYRKKDLKLDNIYGSPVYTYSVTFREQSVIINGLEHPYRRNRDFLHAFDPSVQARISNYLKNNRIKVNKASDPAMYDLVTYCNTQLRP